jgi:hypothetical protein
VVNVMGAAGRRWWREFPERVDAGMFGAFAVFAGLVALLSGFPEHRVWGVCAAAGYCCAALISLSGLPQWMSQWLPQWLPRLFQRRDLTLGAALAGAIVVPLCWLAVAGQAMPEVDVVERSAVLLVRHGLLYETSAQVVSSHQVFGYNPYLPGMAVFGLPYALLGPGMWTDMRLWSGVTFAALLWLALREVGAPEAARRTAWLVASPLIAFSFAVSGNDLPVLGLICLGLAYARGRPVAAGLALGAAAAMKATAWPALLVAGVMFARRDGPKEAGQFAMAAAAVLAVLAGPMTVAQPRALVQNTILFPLGLTSVKSAAASPLPGHLLASTGQAGHDAAIALLIAVGLAIAAAITVRPPRTVEAAARYLALALALMFTLAPATRWGYFVFPLGIYAWLWLSGLGLSGIGADRQPAGSRVRETELMHQR